MGRGERRVLIVEDDADIGPLIEASLSGLGVVTRCCTDGKQALAVAAEWPPDLVTLDLGLPGMDGLEVCRRLRASSEAYIIMVTARQDEIDRLIGFEAGADDYLLKPFSPRELRARVTAMFRRPRTTIELADPVSPAVAVPVVAKPVADHEVLAHGDLRLDVDGRQVHAGEAELALTRTEFELLTELMRAPARVFSRERLLRMVWGDGWSSDTHLVEVHVGNLRRKLADALGGRTVIRTIRGVGYRME